MARMTREARTLIQARAEALSTPQKEVFASDIIRQALKLTSAGNGRDIDLGLILAGTEDRNGVISSKGEEEKR